MENRLGLPMAKKGFVLLVLMAVITGGAFAQVEYANTATLDIGPMIIGVGGAAVMNNMLSSDEGGERSGDTPTASGFGIALQYERQITENFAVGGRFSYLGFGLGMETGGSDASASVNVNFSAWALEGHARFYPGDTFFVDGMLGFASMSAGFKGSIETDGSTPFVIAESFPRAHLKIGAKIGWRIDFGDPGGFVFEPSFGYAYAIGMGDTIPKQMEKYVKDKTGENVQMGEMDSMFDVLAGTIFVGGPRLSLAFGWRF